MCVIAIAHLASSHYPLIVTANRDERHARASAPADWWIDRPGILSGRDLVAGGTWLGVTSTGRFAAVTNVFDSTAGAAELSRGALVGNFLVSSMSATAYRSGIAAESARYGPFNLMLLDRHGLQFASNRGPDASLPPGIHACSNNQPGADWPKVQWLATALKNTLGEPGGTEEIATNDLVARLLEVLSGPSSRGTRTSAPESVFVVGEEFGTRCSTVLAIDRAGRGTFLERSFDRAGTAVGDRQFHFTVPVFATAQPR